MIIQTSRFGPISITEDDIIQFPEGLLGFADLRRFVLLDDPNDEIFAWLQSCEEAHVAFPVLEPELFVSKYQVQLSRYDLEVLKLPTAQGIRCFSIITIPDDPTQMTANLKAPVILNPEKRLGRQCVLQDNNLAIREPMFKSLQQRFVQNPGTVAKTSTIDISVRVPAPIAPKKQPEV